MARYRHSVPLSDSSKRPRKHIKKAERSGVAKSDTTKPTDTKRTIRHSKFFKFKQRVREAQRSIRPCINKEASYRIVRWARDQIELPIADKIRFKPSAIAALHLAAEQITENILEDAYKATLTSKMSELQPSRILDAVEVWSRYNDANLADEFRELAKQCS